MFYAPIPTSVKFFFTDDIGNIMARRQQVALA